MTEREMLADIEGQLAQLRSSAGYFNAGVPNFDHLFGRDACVSALQLLHRDAAPARATLEVLAKYQGQREILRREEFPGKILHEHFPGGWSEKLYNLMFEGDRVRQLSAFILWRFPYYGSVDAGAWYLILLHHYWRKTGDSELVTRLWPVAQGIVDWLGKHAIHTHTGLVGFKRHYVFGLRSQSWKDTMITKIAPPVAMVEVQGYYFYALNLLAEVAEEVAQDAAAATALRTRAEALQLRFHESFVPIDGTYPLAIDGSGRPVANATSNPGHLLFTGILNEDERAIVAKRLMRDDFLTPYGIRTESTREASFDVTSYQNGSVWPFDNWVIEQGLGKTGYSREAAAVKAAVVNVFAKWGNLPELYAVSLEGEVKGIDSACRIQAWSAGALVNLLDNAPRL